MNTTVRRGAVVGVLALLAACGGSDPATTAGGPVATSLPPPSARPQLVFPPLTGPSRTFIFDREHSYPVSDFTKQSQFVLYDNGAFALQYAHMAVGSGFGRGAYKIEGGGIKFLFEWSGRFVDEQWDDATGALKGDSLTVEYEESLKQADFENAVYVLKP